MYNEQKSVLPMTEKRDKKILNVVVADDHQLFVESLRMLLQSTEGYTVNITGVAYNGEELVTMLKTIKPDLLLLDINLPSKNGLEVLQEMKKTMKGTNMKNSQMMMLGVGLMLIVSTQYASSAESTPEKVTVIPRCRHFSFTKSNRYSVL